MTQQPSFSVIVPTYNRTTTLVQSVQSILDQTRQADEIIVVDDGSAEDIAAVLAPFGTKVILIRQDNAGVAAARNTGIAKAQGNWITFLDSDDLWRPTRLEILERDLGEADPDIIAHIGNVIYTGDGYAEDLFSIKGVTFPTDHAEPVDDPLPLVLSGMTLQGAAIRRDAFFEAGQFDTSMRMMSDTDFFCQLALNGPFLMSGVVMSEIIRLEGDQSSITSLHRTKKLFGRQMHVHYLNRLLARDLSHQQKKLVEQRMSGALFRMAQVQSETDRTEAWQTLKRAARIHPSSAKGWIKAVVAGALGPAGYKILQMHYNPLDRS